MSDHPTGKTSCRAWLLIIAACVPLWVCGCSITPLRKHTAAFSRATTAVVNGSEDAYRAANRLYFEEEMSAAVLNYDSQPTWDPHSVQPLLTKQQLRVRYTLLDGLKAYAQNLDKVENSPKRSRGLDAAASGVGNNLVALTANLDQDLGGSKGISISQADANGLSTATKALGEFLIANKVRHGLASKIDEMDPHIQTICKVLQLDITTLQSQADYDYSNLLTQQDLFIRKAGDKLSPVERRAEIRRLPKIVERSETSKALFEDLERAISRLALAHHALALAARGNDPETMRQRIADLQDSGQMLATFYQSLASS
jgi:hypothetical protein